MIAKKIAFCYAVGMKIVVILLQALGSLGFILYGMKLMSEGIQKSAGGSLHRILNMMTGNRVLAVITGFAVTAIVQSSGATTVMTVSFVNAGLLSLTQAIGVIFGANIGTTVTAWIVALLLSNLFQKTSSGKLGRRHHGLRPSFHRPRNPLFTDAGYFRR